MMTRSRMTATTLAVAVILIAPACGKSNVTEDSNAPSAPATMSSSPTPSGPASPQSPVPGAATITIDGFKYSDATVPPGAQVTVINNDSARHTVTSDAAGAFNVEIAGKSQATFTAPNSAGSYAFHCTYHPSMHGTLTVQ